MIPSTKANLHSPEFGRARLDPSDFGCILFDLARVGLGSSILRSSSAQSSGDVIFSDSLRRNRPDSGANELDFNLPPLLGFAGVAVTRYGRLTILGYGP